MELHKFDTIIINTSAGKDSICAIWEVLRMAKEQSYPTENIFLSHQDLGKMEWPGTKELAQKQADFFGLKIYYSHRVDKNGKREDLLEYAKRRKKWPSNRQRWCTSDLKRGPGAKIARQISKERGSKNILYVFGFRSEESPSRSKRPEFAVNKRLTTKRRNVYDWLPVHEWTENKVWYVIRNNNLPYHPAYDLGMPRLSCAFCIFSPFNALVIAGKHNPELLDEYIATEQEIGHSFRNNFKIESVRDAIRDGFEPAFVQNWVM